MTRAQRMIELLEAWKGSGRSEPCPAELVLLAVFLPAVLSRQTGKQVHERILFGLKLPQRTESGVEVLLPDAALVSKDGDAVFAVSFRVDGASSHSQDRVPVGGGRASVGDALRLICSDSDVANAQPATVNALLEFGFLVRDAADKVSGLRVCERRASQKVASVVVGREAVGADWHLPLDLFAREAALHRDELSRALSEYLRQHSGPTSAAREEASTVGARRGHRSRVQPEFERRRAWWCERVPAAAEFMRAIETGGGSRLWVGTASNAHLYKGDGFLAYVRLPGVGRDGPMRISSRFNVRIDEGTFDCSHRLFGRGLRDLVQRRSADGARWVRFDKRGDLVVEPAAPAEFYAELLDLIRSL